MSCKWHVGDCPGCLDCARNAKAKHDNVTQSAPAPRYDEVFAKGVEWLDSLAGDDVGVDVRHFPGPRRSKYVIAHAVEAGCHPWELYHVSTLHEHDPPPVAACATEEAIEAARRLLDR